MFQTCNIRASYPEKHVLLFDEDTLGIYLYVNFHPQVSSAYVQSVDQTLCMTMFSVFGTNISSHEWEVFAQSFCKKLEHSYSSPYLESIARKHTALIDLVNLSKGTNECPHLIVQEIDDRINKGVIENSKRGAT